MTLDMNLEGDRRELEDLIRAWRLMYPDYRFRMIADSGGLMKSGRQRVPHRKWKHGQNRIVRTTK